jgi:hypothetical protein
MSNRIKTILSIIGVILLVYGAIKLAAIIGNS